MNLRILFLVAGIVIVLALIIFDAPTRLKNFKERDQYVSVSVKDGVLVVERTQKALPEEEEKTTIEKFIEVASDIFETDLPEEKELVSYIEITDSCGPYFAGECLNARAAPSTTSPKVGQLRKGMVLRTGGTVEAEGHTWHYVIFDEWLRYPERATEGWYVAGDYVTPFDHETMQEISADSEPIGSKKIVVDRSDQKLYAYDGDTLFMEETTSTGLDTSPTPRGEFVVFRKTPSRYMQGPLPGVSEDYYDLPGVPWTIYFTKEGAAIHGAYWHDKFGSQWSHGCVNLDMEIARKLYEWADLGTRVVVQD